MRDGLWDYGEIVLMSLSALEAEFCPDANAHDKDAREKNHVQMRIASPPMQKR